MSQLRTQRAFEEELEDEFEVEAFFGPLMKIAGSLIGGGGDGEGEWEGEDEAEA